MALLDHRPQFTAEAACRLVADLYRLDVEARPLPSERDQNFLVTDATGARYVFKLANATEDRAFLEAQAEAMDRVAGASSLSPRVVTSRQGVRVAAVGAHDASQWLARLVTWLPGVTMADVRHHSDGLLRDLGSALGRLDRALEGFDHPSLRRQFHWDLSRGFEVVREREALVVDPAMRTLVVSTTEAIEERLRPRMQKLRRGLIHNDANDHNVIVEAGTDAVGRHRRVLGFIDFGDMVESWLAAEPAVAIAYAVLDKPDPLAVAWRIVEGYHAERALTDDEIAAVFDLAVLRLCMSVCIGADQQRQRPDDEYLAVSQQPIRNTLPRLAALPHGLAVATLRHACALEPVPTGKAVVAWLTSRTNAFAPVIEPDVRHTATAVIDLGVTSPFVSTDPAENAEARITPRVLREMARVGASVGIGRYDEARLLYSGPLFEVPDVPTERRTIHLGIDLFAPAGTAVHAPLHGIVHAVACNVAPQDYGGVVVVRHEADGTEPFFTLYGHLSPASMQNLAVGTVVARGRQLARLGEPAENGGWTPHLHFQLITDLLDLGCDFPGVARASQRDLWRALSPDPNVILGIPPERFPKPEPSLSQTLSVRRERLGANLSIAYRDPVKAVRGSMQYLWDDTGRRYLDAYNNVPHVGHCHPRVVAAASRQSALLNTNTRYVHDLVGQYADRLAGTLPEPLRICFFVNSASEANELALRLARAATSARDTIVLDAAYHGHTTTLIDISPYKHDGPGGHGAPDWVHKAPMPDVYRGRYRRDDARAGERYAAHVADIVARLRTQGTGLAAFIAESCPSVGGQIIFPDGYLAAVYDHVRRAGGVCIADEVQTGYGRMGTDFWAFEAQGVVPDIVVMGKPIGNGHPIGAVVTTPRIAKAFANGMEFFSTFGGNTVSCAVGLAVLDVVEEDRLQAHALRVGGALLSRLRPLVSRHPMVGDVRGSGLFLGVELVRDRETLEPAGEEASAVANRMRELGILLGTDGPFHNVIKIRPPMPFDEGNAAELAASLEQALNELL